VPAGKIYFFNQKFSLESGSSSFSRSLSCGRFRKSSSLGEENPKPGEDPRDFEIIIPKSCSSEYSIDHLQYIQFLSKNKKSINSEQKISDYDESLNFIGSNSKTKNNNSEHGDRELKNKFTISKYDDNTNVDNKFLNNIGFKNET
jgi:hypothetical protein